MNNVIPLLEELIACQSITPQDAGCQKIITAKLSECGFTCESMRFDDVDNLWATYGTKPPLIVFAGHTDVVPTGPVSDWSSHPFQPLTRDEYLYGRGAVDMKGALAAMIVAVEKFIKEHPTFNGSIGFLITSDEEGEAKAGTKKVIEELSKRGKKIDYCIIGEPSSHKTVGDQIRIGRRGSLHGKLTIHGKQGHVAHPDFAINSIHLGMAPLAELVASEWDQGNEDFPKTTFQITNMNAGTGVTNVIPGHLEVLFNFRFGTAVAVEELQQRTEAILNKAGLKFDLKWTLASQPFLTQKKELVTAAIKAIKELTNLDTILSTGGGTSDGRFIAPTGAEFIELGVSYATAHHVNECVAIEHVKTLANIYQRILKLIFS